MYRIINIYNYIQLYTYTYTYKMTHTGIHTLIESLLSLQNIIFMHDRCYIYA